MLQQNVQQQRAYNNNNGNISSTLPPEWQKIVDAAQHGQTQLLRAQQRAASVTPAKRQRINFNLQPQLQQSAAPVVTRAGRTIKPSRKYAQV
jgi:hypothetical protein